MTTVILAGSLPVLPKFFQLVIGKLKHPTHSGQSVNSHNGTIRANYSSKYNNLRSTTPWLDPDDATWQLNDSYLPLKEPDRAHAAATKAQVTGGHGQYPSESRALNDPDVDVEDGLQEGIRKTVRIETSLP